ncbi:hypothetical protein TTHERM_001300741 (macronuclear) [Tetrahymena thermophila SB210]|uniref:Uncharacterized protein n=1 Tax=Tetrahymena thermophila (strain SB210) TaxID=312017 RepID=W7WXS7_TETTS|nr:hypothetical protein TTHERM_001300741 [Tetrahymena thermophila SB210]EWS71640.1 hypothetical protein TTHERM_001300741 [Tetrahymena thermophila SB210]|eukprot:XP_012655826.1 hypothetical protein TTHERM_001300741 [Tetrahymena thermophila SB210]
MKFERCVEDTTEIATAALAVSEILLDELTEGQQVPLENDVVPAAELIQLFSTTIACLLPFAYQMDEENNIISSYNTFEFYPQNIFYEVFSITQILGKLVLSIAKIETLSSKIPILSKLEIQHDVFDLFDTDN